MSDFHVIDRVNDALKDLLYQSFLLEPEVGQFFPASDAIKVDSPTVAAAQPNHRLSVFLYQITEDPHMKNRAPVRNGTSTRLRPPPMALRFHYMLTPMAPTVEGNALILGRILETLYDNTAIPIVDPISGRTEDVRVIFETLSLGELAEVWEALREPYRVSLAYQLRVPRLESRREIVVTPVGESTREYAGGVG